ncbi:MAG: DUF3592 domain-containing protein [Candidatus Heimdallarchaeota archaeon]
MSNKESNNFVVRLTKYPVIIRLIIIIFLLINLPLASLFWIVLSGYKHLKKRYSSFSWPTAEGTIKISYIDQYRDDGVLMYKPTINYSYFVMDSEYHSNKVSLSLITAANWRRFATKKIARYPVGKIVKVYYDPTDPSQAVLEPGFKWYTPIWIIGGILFLAIPIAFVAQSFVWFFIWIFIRAWLPWLVYSII